MWASRKYWHPHSIYSVSRLGMAAHGESRPCLQPSPEATSCTIPDVLMFSMVPYVLNVTAIHPQGSSSSLVPFVPEHISEWRWLWGRGLQVLDLEGRLPQGHGT